MIKVISKGLPREKFGESGTVYNYFGDVIWVTHIIQIKLVSIPELIQTWLKSWKGIVNANILMNKILSQMQ